MYDRAEAKYNHPREFYAVITEHVAESRWQTCMCRSCQDKREFLASKIEVPA
jgi:hypothetical protein